VRYDDAYLNGLRAVGDPSVDALVADLARSGHVRAVSRVLRSLVDNDQPVPAELPDPMERWLEATASVPAWADVERMERGCRLVVDHGPQVCLALSTASLVFCYAAYPGVKVLTFSHRLDQDAYRRVGETAQFLLAVTAPGSLGDGGRGVRKIQKVRLLHASIRHLIEHSRRWDSAADGVPICQEDLAGTLLSFSWVVVESLRKLGMRVSDDEAEDYHYRWRVIGEMLGVDPAAIPPDLGAAAELADAIMRRNHRHSAEGAAMTRALFEMHANSLPVGFDGAAPAVTRFLVGDEICDCVEVPHTRWDRIVSLQRAVKLLDRAQSAKGPLGSLTQLISAGMLNQRAVKMAGRRSASFAIPVPAGLQQSWTASGVFPQIDPELLGAAQRAEEG
jgi:uncharacterized protein (DUF2236 family)